MANCKSCGAPILWATALKSGKAIPLDAVPVDSSTLRGRLAVDDESVGNIVRAATEEDVRLGKMLYVSHYATCPHALEWRKR